MDALQFKKDIHKTLNELNKLHDYYFSKPRIKDSKRLIPVAKKLNISPTSLKQKLPVWINYLTTMREIINSVEFSLGPYSRMSKQPTTKEAIVWQNMIVSSFNKAMRIIPPLDVLGKNKDDYPKICFVSTNFSEILNQKIGDKRLEHFDQFADLEDDVENMPLEPSPIEKGIDEGILTIYNRLIEAAKKEPIPEKWVERIKKSE